MYKWCWTQCSRCVSRACLSRPFVCTFTYTSSSTTRPCLHSTTRHASGPFVKCMATIPVGNCGRSVTLHIKTSGSPRVTGARRFLRLSARRTKKCCSCKYHSAPRASENQRPAPSESTSAVTRPWPPCGRRTWPSNTSTKTPAGAPGVT